MIWTVRNNSFFFFKEKELKTFIVIKGEGTWEWLEEINKQENLHNYIILTIKKTDLSN